MPLLTSTILSVVVKGGGNFAIHYFIPFSTFLEIDFHFQFLFFFLPEERGKYDTNSLSFTLQGKG